MNYHRAGRPDQNAQGIVDLRIGQQPVQAVADDARSEDRHEHAVGPHHESTSSRFTHLV